mmetsp:Transcript_13359/g.32714  ORF Transcript_13359/g.32714 Transcript_13359/m.32714 type:complete len:210 (-) Transcript_13359:4-633(-)
MQLHAVSVPTLPEQNILLLRVRGTGREGEPLRALPKRTLRGLLRETPGGRAGKEGGVRARRGRRPGRKREVLGSLLRPRRRCRRGRRRAGADRGEPRRNCGGRRARGLVRVAATTWGAGTRGGARPSSCGERQRAGGLQGIRVLKLAICGSAAIPTCVRKGASKSQSRLCKTCFATMFFIIFIDAFFRVADPHPTKNDMSAFTPARRRK